MSNTNFQARAMAGAALLASSGAAHALSFNITSLPGLNAQAQQAFVDASAGTWPPCPNRALAPCSGWAWPVWRRAAA